MAVLRLNRRRFLQGVTAAAWAGTTRLIDNILVDAAA